VVKFASDVTEQKLKARTPPARSRRSQVAGVIEFGMDDHSRANENFLKTLAIRCRNQGQASQHVRVASERDTPNIVTSGRKL